MHLWEGAPPSLPPPKSADLDSPSSYIGFPTPPLLSDVSSDTSSCHSDGPSPTSSAHSYHNDDTNNHAYQYHSDASNSAHSYVSDSPSSAHSYVSDGPNSAHSSCQSDGPNGRSSAHSIISSSSSSNEDSSSDPTSAIALRHFNELHMKRSYALAFQFHQMTSSAASASDVEDSNVKVKKKRDEDEGGGEVSSKVVVDRKPIFANPKDWDRRPDLVGGHGGFSHLVSSGSGSFGSGHRLSHTPAGAPDFQPPYFPPPYQPQQAMDFHHAQVDPYAHVNPFQQTSQHYNPLAQHTDRNVLAARDMTSHAGALTAYDSRRPDYMTGLRRPDVLHPHSTGHHLGLDPSQDPTLLGLHHNPLQGLEDASQPHIDDTSYLTAEHHNLLRKAGIRPKTEHSKELVVASHAAQPSDVFCSVPGRLSLLSSTSKYKVTVAEVQRRLSPPECLNASLLGGVLRRAKSKNGGRSLRDKLEKIGLSLPAGRRKAANVTLLTSLVEGETLRLARDYSYLCETEYPSRQVAEYTTRHVDPSEYHTRKNMLLAAKQMLNELVDVMKQDRSPINNSRPTPVLEPGIQRHLTHFSLLTHGFGQPAVLASLNCAMNYFTESLKLIDKSYSGSNPGGQGQGQTAGGHGGQGQHGGHAHGGHGGHGGHAPPPHSHSHMGAGGAGAAEAAAVLGMKLKTDKDDVGGHIRE